MLILTFTLALAVGFLFLLVLAVMREVEILRAEIGALSNIIVNPPLPDFIDQPLPAALSEALRSWREGLIGARGAILFVTPQCEACGSLREALRERISRGDILPSAIAVVLDGRDRSRRPYDGLGVVVQLDPGGALFKSCEIRVTPTILIVDSFTNTVTDFRLGGSAEWLQESLRPMQSPR